MSEILQTGPTEVVVDCHGQKVAVARDRSHTDTGRGWLGVRPEKIFASPKDAEDHSGSNVLTGGKISDVSFVGVSTQYLVAMPWGQELMVFEQNTGQRAPFKNGDEVDLAWSHAHAFLLDAEQDAHAGVMTPEDIE
jgi:spermidine/putrescine transport system ATP-binding protein